MVLGEEEEGDVDDGGVVAVVCWLRIVFSRPCICNRLLRRLIAADMGGEGGGLAERSFMGNERGSRHPSPLSLRPLKFYVKRTKFNPRALNFCPKTGSLATSRGAGISYYALSGRRHHSYLYGPRQVLVKSAELLMPRTTQSTSDSNCHPQYFYLVTRTIPMPDH